MHAGNAVLLKAEGVDDGVAMCCGGWSVEPGTLRGADSAFLRRMPPEVSLIELPTIVAPKNKLATHELLGGGADSSWPAGLVKLLPQEQRMAEAAAQRVILEESLGWELVSSNLPYMVVLRCTHNAACFRISVDTEVAAGPAGWGPGSLKELVDAAEMRRAFVLIRGLLLPNNVQRSFQLQQAEVLVLTETQRRRLAQFFSQWHEQSLQASAPANGHKVVDEFHLRRWEICDGMRVLLHIVPEVNSTRMVGARLMQYHQSLTDYWHRIDLSGLKQLANLSSECITPLQAEVVESLELRDLPKCRSAESVMKKVHKPGEVSGPCAACGADGAECSVQ